MSSGAAPALRDAHGNPVGTSSREAVEASDRALWRTMSFYGTPIDDLDAAIAADPAWPLPRLMKAGFLLGLTEPSLAAQARAQLAGALALASRFDERERAHAEALQALTEGDWQLAADRWGALIERHPRDALALQWAHLFDFHRGDTIGLRRRAESALQAWSPADPLHPYVLGHLAFGLEEQGRYDEAEAVGREALAGTARVPWAIHAVAHVMEMQGRHGEGADWLERWRPDWAEGNGFAGHLGWHEALFALEGLDTERALAVFDTHLPAEANEITLQRLDAASLLWRLHLLGADVGDRWHALLAGWPLEGDEVPGQSSFNDLHALLALIGAGQLARARGWVERSIAAAAQAGPWNRTVSRDVTAPLLRGMLAFGEGHATEAAALLAPLQAGLAAIGGSHAQRDVVEQTVWAASAGTDLAAAARERFERRAAGRAATPLAEWWRGRLAGAR